MTQNYQDRQKYVDKDNNEYNKISKEYLSAKKLAGIAETLAEVNPSLAEIVKESTLDELYQVFGRHLSK